jgi:hypothetical protein
MPHDLQPFPLETTASMRIVTAFNATKQKYWLSQVGTPSRLICFISEAGRVSLNTSTNPENYRASRLKGVYETV